MTQVIHIATNLQTTFGVLDEDGNVIQNVVVPNDDKGQPVAFNINKLDKSSFVEVFNQLVEIKAKILTQVNEAQTQTQNTLVPTTEEILD